MPGLSTFIVVLAVILDLLVAISFPFFPTLNLFIVGITFTNNTAGDGTSVFQTPNSSFNGQVNSVGVQNLIDIHVSSCSRFYIYILKLGFNYSPPSSWVSGKP